MLNQIKQIFSKNKKSYGEYDNSVGGYAFFGNKRNNIITRGDLLDLYKGYSFVCINVRSEFIAGLDRKLFWNNKRYDREKNHEYMNLITYDLLLEISAYLDITGIAFIRKISFGNRIDELEVLRSDLVNVRKTLKGNILGYEYNINGNINFYSTDEVFTIKEFSPYKDGLGLGTLGALGIQQSMDDESLKWNWNFFKNNASSGVVLSTEHKMEQEDQKFLLEHWRSEFMGADNAHKLAILDNGLKQTEKNPGQKDMDFVEQRKMIRDEIFMIFRVSKVLIGLNEGVGYTDRTVAYENLARIFGKPRCRKLEEAFNKHIFKGIGYFAFQNIIPLDTTQLLEDYRIGAISLNEYRIKRNYQKVKDGNILINGEHIEYEEDNKKNLSLNITSVFDKSVKQVENEKEKKLQKRWEQKVERTDKYEKKFNLLMNNIFSLQEKEVLKILDKFSKGSEDIKEDDLFSQTAFFIIYQNQFKSLFHSLISKEGQIAINEIGAYTFSMIEPEKWIGKNIKKFAKQVDMTTKKEIIEIIKEGSKQGLGTAEINKNIRGKFKQYSTSRVNKISRTEITKGVNYARVESWGQTNVVVSKQWWTALDERVSTECQELHGKKVGLKENFFNLGDTDNGGREIDYEDIAGPPRHTNCRCDLIPIL